MFLNISGWPHVLEYTGCTGKKCTGKCTGKYILFMACTGNVLGYFKIRANIFYAYIGEPISPILPIFPIFPIFKAVLRKL